MSETKWTKGPWKACHAGKCSCRQVWCPDAPVFTAKEDACVNIGTAHQQWGDTPELLYGEIPEEQTEANANLIAAAPELYDALEDLMRFGSHDGPCEKLEPGSACALHLAATLDRVEKARAALAKARGETATQLPSSRPSKKPRTKPEVSS